MMMLGLEGFIRSLYDSKPLFWIHYCTAIVFNCDTQPSSVKCTTKVLNVALDMRD